MLTARIESTRSLSPRVREIVLAPPRGFAFEPGQWVRVSIPRPGGSTVFRDYSIASPAGPRDTFAIAVARTEGSATGEYLHSRQPGDTLEISPPRGDFLLGTVTRPVLMVATGTGVSPLRAMLLGLPRDPSLPSFALLLGARNEDELIYRADFEALAQRGRLAFVPTLSEPSPSWRGRRGWVQHHAADVLRTLGPDCDVLIAGHGAMVRAMSPVLHAAGVVPSRVRAERYD